jgi:hypothetical protein
MILIQSDTLESICDEILHLDPKIRFVGIINDKGRLLAENKKEGTEVLVDPKEQEILLMEIALGVRMRREHDKHLGTVKFTISHGEMHVSMNFPLGEKILCITAEKEVDVLRMAFLILQVLETK